MRLMCSSRKCSDIMTPAWWIANLVPATESTPHKDTRCGLSRRVGDCRYIERHLATVALLAGRGDLAIRLVVDHGPAAVFLEREVDNPLYEGAVGESKCNRCLTAARAARIGRVRATEELVGQQSLRHRRRRGRLVV